MAMTECVNVPGIGILTLGKVQSIQVYKYTCTFDQKCILLFTLWWKSIVSKTKVYFFTVRWKDYLFSTLSTQLQNHELTMITASPNIHQTAAVVSNWQALLVLFEIEGKKSVWTQRETKLSPASWLERKSRFEIMWTWSDMFCKRW